MVYRSSDVAPVAIQRSQIGYNLPYYLLQLYTDVRCRVGAFLAERDGSTRRTRARSPSGKRELKGEKRLEAGRTRGRYKGKARKTNES